MRWQITVDFSLSLKDLYLGENHRLKKLPHNFGFLIRLAELDISSCSLDHLPESLSNCTSLSKVWMSHNKWAANFGWFRRIHRFSRLYSLPFMDGLKAVSESHPHLYFYPTIVSFTEWKVSKKFFFFFSFFEIHI